MPNLKGRGRGPERARRRARLPRLPSRSCLRTFPLLTRTCWRKKASCTTACCGSRPSSRTTANAFSMKKRSEEHTSELQSRLHLVCRLLLEKKNKTIFVLDVCSNILLFVSYIRSQH